MMPTRSIVLPGLLAVDQISQRIASHSHDQCESKGASIDIADGSAAFPIIALPLIIHLVPHLGGALGHTRHRISGLLIKVLSTALRTVAAPALRMMSASRFHIHLLLTRLLRSPNAARVTRFNLGGRSGVPQSEPERYLAKNTRLSADKAALSVRFPSPLGALAATTV